MIELLVAFNKLLNSKNINFKECKYILKVT